MVLLIDAKNLEARLVGQSVCASGIGSIWSCGGVWVNIGLDVCHNAISVHENRLWDERLHSMNNVHIHVIELLFRLLERDIIAMTVLILQVVG